MKVILLTDVPKVGRRGEVKNVPDGYARNFIIARGLGRVATDDVVRSVERDSAEKKKRADAEVKATDKAIEDASKRTLVLERSGNADGLLFAGIKAIEIADALNREGISLAVECIDLSKPIKKKGTSEVPLISPSGKKAVLVVEVKG